MVNSAGEWELDFVEEWLPAYVRDTIRSISPPSETGRPDILAWTPSRDGEFTVRSAYIAVAKLQYKPNPPIFRVLWEWEGPKRIKLLLWRVAKSAMLTNEERFRRRLTMDPTCPRCSGGPERFLMSYVIALWLLQCGWRFFTFQLLIFSSILIFPFGCRITLVVEASSIGALCSGWLSTCCGGLGTTWSSTIRAGILTLWLVWCRTTWRE